MPTESVTLFGLNSDHKKPGTVDVRIWSKNERVQRSVKGLGVTWGLALVSVLVPIAHFLLVPLFFLAGPVVAWVLFKKEKMILGGRGACPDCGKDLPISKGGYAFPLSEICESCRHNIRIELTS